MSDKILAYDKFMKKSKTFLRIDHANHNFDAIILDMAFAED